MQNREDLLATIDSLNSIDETTELLPRSDERIIDKWRSIKITYAVMFFTSVSYSIQMPSLWPYMNIIDESYTKEFLGWVVAVYSIGQLCACPLFSYLSGRKGCFKLILIFSSVLAVAGNYLYSVIVDFEGALNKKILLLTARILIGISGGNIASIRLFLTLATTEEERIGPMSILSASQGLGFIIGPGLQAAFVPIGYPGILDKPFFRINMYTASGFFGVLSNIVILILILIYFKAGFLKKRNLEIQTSDSIKTFDKYEKIRVVEKEFINDYFSAIFMLIAFFICMMSLAVLETSTTPLTMDNFAWSKSHATLINSIILASSGICAIGIFISLRFIVKIFKEKIIIIFGFVLILGSAIFLIPFGSNIIPCQGMNSSVGCNYTIQPWCKYVPQLEIWQYGISIFLFTFGYPTANVLSYVIFSRLIDPSAQSLWMGLLTASGSLARVIGPIFISKLYEMEGTQVAFGIWSGVVLLFLISTPLFIWKSSKTDKLKETYRAINT